MVGGGRGRGGSGATNGTSKGSQKRRMLPRKNCGRRDKDHVMKHELSSWFHTLIRLHNKAKRAALQA